MILKPAISNKFNSNNNNNTILTKPNIDNKQRIAINPSINNNNKPSTK